jgi:hypothetical protein
MKVYLLIAAIALAGVAAWTEAANPQKSSPAQVVFYVQ